MINYISKLNIAANNYFNSLNKTFAGMARHACIYCNHAPGSGGGSGLVWHPEQIVVGPTGSRCNTTPTLTASYEIPYRTGNICEYVACSGAGGGVIKTIVTTASCTAQLASYWQKIPDYTNVTQSLPPQQEI
jgi:hypothetical protein